MHLDKIAFYGAGWQIHAESLGGHLEGGELVPPYQDLAAKIG